MPSDLTWRGRPVYTVALAGLAHGVSRRTMSRTLARLPVRPIDPNPLGDERAPLYWADEVDEAMANRASASWARGD